MIIRRDDIEPFEWDGLSIRDFTAGLDTSSSLAVITVPPGAVHARAYSTRSAKYYYLSEGVLEFTLGDGRHALTAGDVAIVPIGELFGYTNTGSGTATLVLVHTPGFDQDAERFAEEDA